MLPCLLRVEWTWNPALFAEREGSVGAELGDAVDDQAEAITSKWPSALIAVYNMYSLAQAASAFRIESRLAEQIARELFSLADRRLDEEDVDARQRRPLSRVVDVDLEAHDVIHANLAG